MIGTNEGLGYSALTLWAQAGGVSAPALRASFAARYGKTTLETMGEMLRRLNQGVVMEKFRDKIEDGASKTEPLPSDFYGAMIEVGAEPPRTLEVIKKTAEDVGESVFSGLKFLGVVILIGGVAYLAWELGWIKKYASAT